MSRPTTGVGRGRFRGAGEIADAGRHTVSLTVPAKPDYLGVARLALSGVCRAVGAQADALDDLKLAVTEVAARFVTAVGVVADQAPPRQVSYVFRVEDQRLAIEIAGAPLRRLPPEELALARAILEATVDQWSEQVDSVQLVKFLGPRAE